MFFTLPCWLSVPQKGRSTRMLRVILITRPEEQIAVPKFLHETLVDRVKHRLEDLLHALLCVPLLIGVVQDQDIGGSQIPLLTLSWISIRARSAGTSGTCKPYPCPCLWAVERFRADARPWRKASAPCSYPEMCSRKSCRMLSPDCRLNTCTQSLAFVR